MSSPGNAARLARIKRLLKRKKLKKSAKKRLLYTFSRRDRLKLLPSSSAAALIGVVSGRTFAPNEGSIPRLKSMRDDRIGRSRKDFPRHANQGTLIPGTRYLSSNCMAYELFPPWNTYSLTWQPATYAGRIASKGAITKGDFKTPNAWTYDVKDERYWFGTQEQYDLSNGKYLMSMRRRGYWGDFWGKTLDYPPWERNTIYNIALGKLSDQVRGDLDLAVDLAEFGQTRRMLKGRSLEVFSSLSLIGHASADQVKRRALLDKSLKALHKFAETARFTPVRGVGKAVAMTSSVLANGLLEYKYGWRPLMATVFGVANENVRHVLNNLKNFKVSAKLPLPASYKPQNYLDVYYSVEGIQACTIKCVLEVPGGFDLTRWSSLNPLSLTWELIPYSFVVDWVYDLGSYLRNLENSILYQLRFKSGFVSEIYKANILGFIPKQQRTDSATRFTLYGPYTCSGEWARFQRSLLTTYPAPRRPSVRTDLGAERLLTAAALLRQLIKR